MASEIILPLQESTSSTPLTSSTPPRQLLTGFVRLCPDASLYTPPQGTPPPPATSPTTIIFTAWMNAAPKHIDYYMRTYKLIYPSARIIFTRISTVQFLFTTEATRRRQIAPVVDALLSFESAHGHEKERIVFHSISNGGAKRAYGIAGLYLQRTGRVLPVKSFLFDSAPGIPQFRRDMHALTVPLRGMNPVVAAPLYVLFFVSVSAVYVCVNWLPKWVWGELVWKPTILSNDFGFFAKEGVRGYVYSEEDLSIDWMDVEKHAKRAEQVGYRVLMKKVEGAGHAQLWNGKGGAEDYWGWIRGLYEAGFGLR